MTTQTIVPTEDIQTAVNRNDAHEEAATKIISKYTLITSGATLVPVDFVDVASSTITHTLMIRELCKLYQVPYSDQLPTVAMWSAIGSVAIKAITKVVQQILSTSGASGGFDFSGAAVSGIYTTILGEFYKIHLRDGGSLEDVDVKDFASYFIEEIKRGDISLSTFTNPKALMNQLNLSI